VLRQPICPMTGSASSDLAPARRYPRTRDTDPRPRTSHVNATFFTSKRQQRKMLRPVLPPTVRYPVTCARGVQVLFGIPTSAPVVNQTVTKIGHVIADQLFHR